MEETTRTVQTLPTELISQIISHLYDDSWSLSILERAPKPGPLALPVTGYPLITSTLFLTSQLIKTLATRREKRTFSGRLIFTTAGTHWRTLSRLRTLSPTRMSWVLDNITTLVFSCPPLFTSRIPYTTLPGLRRIELDYRGRSSKFRCQGPLQEAEAATLAGLIVSFARDTDRFDGAIVEDAWGVRFAGLDSSRSVPRGVEVLVIKRMQVFHHVAFQIGAMMTDRVEQVWDLTVTATHRGQLEEVLVSVKAGHGVKCQGFESTIWTHDVDGKAEFREKLAALSKAYKLEANVLRDG